MKSETAFFDTNVLIYAFSTDALRANVAMALLAGGGAISVQTLNEFVAIAVRKLAMHWDDLLTALQAIRVLCLPPEPLTVETHDVALRIASRYGYRVYDSMMIAAALRASCKTLYSEDMHSGQVIEGLTIRNPSKVD